MYLRMAFNKRKDIQFENVANFWPVELDAGDTVFSDIAEAGLLEEEEEFQCTQKFLDDIHEIKEPSIEPSASVCGSQYFTSNHHINKSKSDGIPNKIGGVTDNMWKTQDLMTEIFDFPNKGSLPQKVWQLINEHKGIFNLYDWQKECLRLPAVQQRRNLLYALPTSGGKTLVAEILMLREIICRDKNVIFILPYVSIVQEKVSSMSAFAFAFNFLVEEYAGGKGRCPPVKRNTRKTLFISSIEKGAILFDSLVEANRANEIGMVVVDELHLLGESGRGAILETFLTKVMYLKVGIQIIAMSATIGNISQISKFLNADVYTRGFRPVELKEYIKCGNDILEINPEGKKLENIFVYRRTVNFKYSTKVKKVDPDHLGGLVSEIIPESSCLIFCSTRRNCENVAILLSKILPRRRYIEHRRNEKSALLDALQKACGTLSPILEETITYGIAFHHSGLTTDERKILENAYRCGTICVICCTSTLAAGVNLPAKRVIIRAPYVGNKFMTLSQYKQMVGRAGRAGLGDAGESFLICSAKDNYQVGQMFFSPMDKIISSLDHQGCIGLQALILSSIGLTIASCLKDLVDLCSISLFAIQTNEGETSLIALITNILRDMFKNKILEVPDTNFESPHSSDIITSQEISNNPQSTNYKTYVLRKSTKINLTAIGKAAFKAGIDYGKVESICDGLKMAQRALVLTSYAHLLYLVLIFNTSDDSIAPDPRILFEQYNGLDDKIRDFVMVLGITETHMIKMARTLSLKGPMENSLVKLYKTFILIDIINLMPIHEVSTKYSLERGSLQNLITQSISATSTMIRLCEQIQEFWCFKPLFEKLLEKLDYCCSVELTALLEIPSVKIYRAKQLFTAGYRSIEDVAKSNAHQLVRSIDHLSVKTAREMISAAKVILLKKLEVLQEETAYLVECLNA